MSLMIILGFAAILFTSSYITKRKFGVLGLGLCAGALLSQYFAGDAVAFAEANGVILLSPPLTTVISVGLVLLPPFLLLFGGPKYSSQKAVWVSSVAFAAFGLLLLAVPLTGNMLLDAPSLYAVNFIETYDTYLVAVGILFAVADMMLIHAPKFGRRGNNH